MKAANGEEEDVSEKIVKDAKSIQNTSKVKVYTFVGFLVAL
jgi:hypothetical protein